MEKRGYLQISFAWIFAIIVGVFILFLAIYATMKFVGTEQTTLDAKTSKEIGILLDPLETSVGTTATITYFTMPVETRIYNKCDDFGNFGEQIIQISQKSFNKWTDTNVDVSFENKYIFSEKEVEGKKYYIFSKPFEFPFKIANLFYMFPSTKKFCFIDAPEYIEEEISSLNNENLLLEEDCDKGDIKVCFMEDCEITVNLYLGYVEKDNEKMYFEDDALMYAAIFAEPEIYECQLKRLMKRLDNLAMLYNDKANFIARTGCNSYLDLNSLANLARNLNSSNSLTSITYLKEEIENKNELANCKLW